MLQILKDYKTNTKIISILFIFVKKFCTMQQTPQQPYIVTEAKAWLNREDGSCMVLRVICLDAPAGQQYYELYPAYDQIGEDLGRVLFDTSGYWIYDGNDLSIAEQEQVADFIINYVERI
jgi:hypothetical protein